MSAASVRFLQNSQCLLAYDSLHVIWLYSSHALHHFPLAHALHMCFCYPAWFQTSFHVILNIRPLCRSQPLTCTSRCPIATLTNFSGLHCSEALCHTYSLVPCVHNIAVSCLCARPTCQIHAEHKMQDPYKTWSLPSTPVLLNLMKLVLRTYTINHELLNTLCNRNIKDKQPNNTVLSQQASVSVSCCQVSLPASQHFVAWWQEFWQR